jgi:hypothetical protein
VRSEGRPARLGTVFVPIQGMNLRTASITPPCPPLRRIAAVFVTAICLLAFGPPGIARSKPIHQNSPQPEELFAALSEIKLTDLGRLKNILAVPETPNGEFTPPLFIPIALHSNIYYLRATEVEYVRLVDGAVLRLTPSKAKCLAAAPIVERISHLAVTPLKDVTIAGQPGQMLAGRVRSSASAILTNVRLLTERGCVAYFEITQK